MGTRPSLAGWGACGLRAEVVGFEDQLLPGRMMVAWKRTELSGGVSKWLGAAHACQLLVASEAPGACKQGFQWPCAWRTSQLARAGGECSGQGSPLLTSAARAARR